MFLKKSPLYLYSKHIKLWQRDKNQTRIQEKSLSVKERQVNLKNRTTNMTEAKKPTGGRDDKGLNPYDLSSVGKWLRDFLRKDKPLFVPRQKGNPYSGWRKIEPKK